MRMPMKVNNNTIKKHKASTGGYLEKRYRVKRKVKNLDICNNAYVTSQSIGKYLENGWCIVDTDKSPFLD